MEVSTPTSEDPLTDGNHQIFPFLKLPGELRNQCYKEVLYLCEQEDYLRVSKNANVHTQAKHSTAWTLTQVSKQIRAELLPLVLLQRCPRVALSHLAEYLRVFYQNANGKASICTDEQAANRDAGQHPLELSRRGKLKVWISSLDLHSKLPSKGVDLLPIVDALLECEDVKADFHSWCIFNWELYIVKTMYKSYKIWWPRDLFSVGGAPFSPSTLSLLSVLLPRHFPSSSDTRYVTSGNDPPEAIQTAIELLEKHYKAREADDPMDVSEPPRYCTQLFDAAGAFRDDVKRLGFQSILLQTEHGAAGYPRGRLGSSITVKCKATEHTSERKRVRDLADWLWGTQLWTVDDRVTRLTILFITPKTLHGQATKVKFSVFERSVKFEWWCRGSYCKARLVTDGLGFEVEKKEVEGKDVLRL